MTLLASTVLGITLISLGFLFGNYFCKYRIISNTLNLNEIGIKQMSKDISAQMKEECELDEGEVGYVAMYVVIDVITGKILDNENLETLKESDNFWNLN